MPKRHSKRTYLKDTKSRLPEDKPNPWPLRLSAEQHDFLNRITVAIDQPKTEVFRYCLELFADRVPRVGVDDAIRDALAFRRKQVPYNSISLDKPAPPAPAPIAPKGGTKSGTSGESIKKTK
jgi:hypothetical protein